MNLNEIKTDIIITICSCTIILSIKSSVFSKTNYMTSFYQHCAYGVGNKVGWPEVKVYIGEVTSVNQSSLPSPCGVCWSGVWNSVSFFYHVNPHTQFFQIICIQQEASPLAVAACKTCRRPVWCPPSQSPCTLFVASKIRGHKEGLAPAVRTHASSVNKA